MGGQGLDGGGQSCDGGPASLPLGKTLILGKEKLPEKFTIKIGNISLSPENQVTLLGVTLDNKLNFEAHIQKMCKEA